MNDMIIIKQTLESIQLMIIDLDHRLRDLEKKVSDKNSENGVGNRIPHTAKEVMPMR